MLYRALDNIAKKHPHKVAIVGAHAAYTFSERLRQVRGVTLHLQDQGLGPGDHLVVGISPSPEFYALFFAAAAPGITTTSAPASGKLPASIKALQPLALAGSKDFIATVTGGGIKLRHTILWQAQHDLAIASPPAEIEDALRSHPHVQDAIVFPVRTRQADEAVGAVVVPNGRATTDELAEHCARQLDAYKCPPTFSFRKSLPRNARGKVIRYLYEQPSGGLQPVSNNRSRLYRVKQRIRRDGKSFSSPNHLTGGRLAGYPLAGPIQCVQRHVEAISSQH